MDEQDRRHVVATLIIWRSDMMQLTQLEVRAGLQIIYTGKQDLSSIICGMETTSAKKVAEPAEVNSIA